MRKFLATHGVAIGALLLQSFAFGQSPTPSATPAPQTSTLAPVLTSTLTPTPIPTPSLTPGPTSTPSPESTPYQASAVTTSSTFQYSEEGAPVYTIDKAVITALRQNPDILRALQEIQRSKGVIIEIRAQALPHVGPNALYDWTDPNIHGGGFSTGTGGGKLVQSDVAYEIRVTGTQLIFNGTTWPSIRGTFFQRDAAYFSFRNVVDQTISTVKQQFYQVVVNRALIGVQEESVRLLESQLQDQQNRFEAGTVPRFNVLQAQVQLSNQIPNLIAARNNYRISILQLAKTLGLDYDPRRGVAAPIHVVGELTYVPRRISLIDEIEFGKQNRALLKQARANVLNQIEQVHVALGGFLPTINTTGGGDWLSSPLNSSWHDISKGWIAHVEGSWPIWDSGQVWGQFKQQRALLSEAKITYDDSVRQVELEIQQAASNLLQNRELIQATVKTVEQADESVRLAKARLDAGAGTQLDVLNAQVQLTTAQSTRLQALFGYIASLAEFDRVTGTQSVFSESFNKFAPHSTRSAIYDTGSGVDAAGKRKPPSSNPFANDTTTGDQRRPYSK